MIQDEVQKSKVLVSWDVFLARLRDSRWITEAEYIDQLNALRKQHGLFPIRPEVPSQASNARSDI